MTASIGAVRGAVCPRLLLMALFFRLLQIIFMAFVDAAIPDHNAGKDVIRFDLRTTSQCFCLQGFICDPDWKSYSQSSLQRSCVEAGLASEGRSVSQFFLQPLTKWDAARFLQLAADGTRRQPMDWLHDNPFSNSEQAHAFFPFFPLLIRTVALLLTRLLPKAILPSTFEGVLVLSALLVNTISFSIALQCLVDLTLRLTLPNEKAVRVAGTVATLFCLNPASIFFATSYSESVFAMCTFGGYALYTAGYSYLALIPWMAASFTRSNGCLVAIWLLLQGLGCFLKSNSGTTFLQRNFSLVYHIVLAIAVVMPVILHDQTGYALHCHGELQPKWCHSEMRSLYAHVQRTHWNVGLLRYYELKQIPNFILAAPILFFSLSGVSRWIRSSWRELSPPSDDTKCGLLHCIVRWALLALRHSTNYADTIRCNSVETMLHRPTMLPHYCVLAASALLGLTVAHVQITTRLISSTCPALYWHIAYLCYDDTKVLGFSNRIIVWVYLGVFIVVGTILHVNFLPWT